MEVISKKDLDVRREEYPSGTLIRLVSMNDEARPVAQGTLGLVKHVDDIGTLHTRWLVSDDPASWRLLGVIPEIDEFEVLRKGSAIFRIEGSVRLSRPFVEEECYFSPGGYTMTFGGKKIVFDFTETSWGVSKDDPCVIEFMSRNPDYEYETTNLIVSEDFSKIDSIDDFHIYTEWEDGTEPFVPVEIIEASLIDVRDGFKTYDIPKALLNAVSFEGGESRVC